MLPEIPGADAVAVSASVRRPVLSGQWLVAALWFPADWYPPAQRQVRMLDYWQVGSRAMRFERGDLLCFAEARWLDCGVLPGWPLQRIAQGLCSAALQETELEGLAQADLWLVEGGQPVPFSMANAVLLDPSTWISTVGLALLDTFDCREALPDPELLIQFQPARSVREVLEGAVPPPSEALREYLAQNDRSVSPRVKLAVSTLKFGRLVFWFVIGIFWLGVMFDLLGHGADPASAQGVAVPVPTGWMLPLWLLLVPAGLGGIWLIKQRLLTTLRRLASEPEPVVLEAHRSLPSTGKVHADGHTTEAIIAGSQTTPAVSHVAKRQRGWRAATEGVRERLRQQFAPQPWRNWMVRLARASLVSQLIARKQSDHLNRVMQMFQSGQLDEALRNAIPLGGKNGESLGQAFGTPQRRASLELSRRLGPGTSINLANEAEEALRRLYRAGFEKLDREGRIDEAVFVLAELLQNRAEALEYLERHQRFAQAAELALAWDMAPAMIVRLHCLAGNWRVAIAVARRDRVFAEVVPLLEPKWPDVARRMRMEWGEFLAAQGAWLDAVNAVWPVGDARETARSWLMHAERNGGELAARALVLRAVMIPESLDDYAEEMVSLRDDALRHTDRMVIVDTLLAMKTVPAPALRLLRLLLPMLLADQARGRGKYSAKVLQRVMSLANDRFLTMDLPSASLPVNRSDSRWEREQGLVYTAPSSGTLPILDAVPLLDAAYLVAFGESGAAVVSDQGVVLQRFAAPAEILVIAESRQIALALARRDEVWRISRIDLAQRSVTDLGMLALEHFARDFDGVNWSVVSKGIYRVLDTTQGLNTAVWQVHDLPGEVIRFHSGKQCEQLLIRTPENRLQLWWYRMPFRTLASRDELPPFGENESPLLVPWTNRLFLGVKSGEQEGRALYFHHGNPQAWKAISCVDCWPERIAVAENWLVLQVSAQGQTRALLLYANQQTCKARLDWPSAGLNTRIVDTHWLGFDNAGRLFHLDLKTGVQVNLSI